jgi:hypothetical protein
MRAELATLSSPPPRRGFAAGCLRAAVLRPDTARRIGYPALMLGTLTTMVVWTSGIGYMPLRWGLVASAGVLLAVAWCGRRPGLLGPVGTGRAARLTRVGGYLLVGGMGVAFVFSTGAHGDPGERARTGVPILTLFLISYLLGFLALTAHCSAATERALATGIGAGGGCAVLWLTIVVAFPPVPDDTGLALLVTAVAIGAGAWAGTGRTGGTGQRLLAALCAGTLAPLLVFVAVVLLSTYGPARLIPQLVPAALSPADQLANSRIEIQDPYVGLLLVAALLASALTVASIATRHLPEENDEQSILWPARRN